MAHPLLWAGAIGAGLFGLGALARRNEPYYDQEYEEPPWIPLARASEHARYLEERKPGQDFFAVRDFNNREIRLWKVENLWELAESSPTVDVDLNQIPQIDTDWYFGYVELPTVRRVAQEAAQIERADLRYPIILDPEGNLLDGAHRLGKAYREGKSTIKAKKMPFMPAPDKVLSF